MQASSASSMSAVMWVGVLIVVAVVGGLAILYLRRRVLAEAGDADAQGGLMESLRAMRDSGEISQEEFDAARSSMLRRVKEQVAADERRKAEAAQGQGKR
jgi:uncharacterized membrane protein